MRLTGNSSEIGLAWVIKYQSDISRSIGGLASTDPGNSWSGGRRTCLVRSARQNEPDQAAAHAPAVEGLTPHIVKATREATPAAA